MIANPIKMSPVLNQLLFLWKKEKVTSANPLQTANGSKEYFKKTRKKMQKA